MTPADFDRIEAALGIKLPRHYRELLAAQANEIAEASVPLYLQAKEVIAENLAERRRDRGIENTGAAFPKWWKKFVIIGTNAAAEYYCLSLTGDKQVWMIGNEHGNKAQREHQSLAQFIDYFIQEHRHPPPLPSSFDAGCPLIKRFDIHLWEDKCEISALEGDRPLTADKLRRHGIKIAAVRSSVRKLVGALAGRKPREIKLADPPQTTDEGGCLVILFHQPEMRDPRVTAATGFICNGLIKLWLRAANAHCEMPAVKQTPVDWAAVQAGIVELLETLHPPGTRAKITQPKENGWWEYLMRYTLK